MKLALRVCISITFISLISACDSSNAPTLAERKVGITDLRTEHNAPAPNVPSRTPQLSPLSEAPATSVDNRLAHAKQLMEESRLVEALAQLDEMVKAHPKRLDVRCVRVKCYFMLGRTNAAAAELAEAKADFPDSADVRCLCAELYFHQAAFGELDAGLSIQLRLQELNRAVSIDAKHTKALSSRLRVLLDCGKVAEATKDLRLLKSLGDDSPDYLIGAAFYEIAVGDPVLGQQLLTLLSRSPDAQVRIWGHTGMSFYYERCKPSRYKEAIEEMSKAIRLRRDAFLLCRRAGLCSAIGRFQKAAADLNDVLLLSNREHPVIRLQRAMCSAMDRRYSGTVPEFLEYTKVVHDDPRAWLGVASIHFDLGHYKQSAEFYEKAWSYDKGNLCYRAGSAECYAVLGAFEIALSQCESVLAGRCTVPVRAQANKTRAMALLGQNKIKDAIEACERAVSLAPDVPMYRYSLAYCHFCNDEFAQANRLLREIRLRNRSELLERAIHASANCSSNTIMTDDHSAYSSGHRHSGELTVEDYNRMIADDPGDSLLLLGKAKLLLSFGRGIEAEVCLNEILRHDSLCWVAHLERAMLALKTMPMEAVAECEKGLRLNPGSYELWATIGRAHLRCKDYSLAIADFEAALKLCRTDATVYRECAIARRANGDVTGASADDAMAAKLDRGVFPTPFEFQQELLLQEHASHRLVILEHGDSD